MRESSRGGIGALLHRERVYASTLNRWRQQRERGEVTGLAPKRQELAPRGKDLLESKVAVLEKENTRLRARAERAEALIELQKSLGHPGGGVEPPGREELMRSSMRSATP